MIWMNKVLGQGLFMEHCSFEFQIFVGFESWWCDLGLPKEGKSREEEKFQTHSFGKCGRSYKNFVVENHIFSFDIHIF
jgi:hypothetical protein